MDRLEICPFNESHRVLASRMAKHLLKCQRSHSTQGTAICRFNNSHVVRAEEIQQHEEDCRDRLIVDRFIIDIHPEPAEDKKKWRGLRVLKDENWDKANFPTYDPKLAIEQRRSEQVIFTRVQHGTPSQLRDLRDQQSAQNKQALQRQKRANIRKKFMNGLKYSGYETEEPDEEPNLNPFAGMTENPMAGAGGPNPFINSSVTDVSTAGNLGAVKKNFGGAKKNKKTRRGAEGKKQYESDSELPDEPTDIEAEPLLHDSEEENDSDGTVKKHLDFLMVPPKPTPVKDPKNAPSCGEVAAAVVDDTSQPQQPNNVTRDGKSEPYARSDYGSSVWIRDSTNDAFNEYLLSITTEPSTEFYYESENERESNYDQDYVEQWVESQSFGGIIPTDMASRGKRLLDFATRSKAVTPKKTDLGLVNFAAKLAEDNPPAGVVQTDGIVTFEEFLKFIKNRNNGKDKESK